MKVKAIFTALVAALFFAAGCESNTLNVLEEVQVSSSYVAINVNGGSQNITVNAVSSWSIADIPSWLTVSPASGSAGETQVTFSAASTLDGRTAEVHLNCDGKTQNINVIQGLAVVSPATCAEVIAGPDGKTYRVSGVVESIYNTQYGNWYLRDETGVITIYGTLDAQGKTKNFLSLGLENGDEVTVEGPKTTYNGTTVELVDVTVLNIKKSLIKVENIIVGCDTTDVIPIEGGAFVADLMCKGNGVSVVIPDFAQEWLSITGVTTSDGSAKVYFYAQPNDGGDREVTIEFQTSDGKKEYAATRSLIQTGSIVDITVAGFNDSPVSNTQYRVSAMVTKIAKADYGNFYIKDWSGETYVYGLGAKGYFETTGIDVGDIVTLVGTRGQYGTTIEMLNAQLESKVDVEEVSIANFLTKPDSSTDWYRLTGKITKIANTTYGNLYIADEDGNEVYVYGCYPGYGASGDNRKNFLAAAGIEEGDILTIAGYKDTYNGTIELCGGAYVSHEKPVGPMTYYQKVSTVTSGKSYLLVADGKAAGLLAGKTYGYLSANDVPVTDGNITAEFTEYEFVVTAAEGGYTIACGGQYLYQSGTYNSFNWSSAPTEGNIWTIEPQTDGTCKVTNASVGKWMQLDAQYGTWGSYNSEKGAYPTFYEKL